MNDCLKALALLTVVPCRPRWDDDAPAGRAMAWYPAVGLVVGLPPAAVWLLLHGAGSRHELLAAALVLLSWVVITGGLHLDGWSDCCDGLLASVDRERRLEILKDPRLGSFGGAGLVLLLLLKLAAIRALGGGAALLVAPVLARWVVVLTARTWPCARPGGLGDRMRAGLGTREPILATVTALAVALAAGATGVLAVPVALAAGAAFARFAAGKLGGLTGDCYGAQIELVELVVLLLFALAGSV
ncbi:MAG: adenosylcobinamide-GDP ribazoletransferase [Armatimonadetes bacterium]|nr:adenosylcobinamide-GDP ribazoletransferase [Armatimonadota bacterium]